MPPLRWIGGGDTQSRGHTKQDMEVPIAARLWAEFVTPLRDRSRRRSASPLDLFAVQGLYHCLGPGPGVEFFHRVADVGADRLRREDEALGDLLARQPLRQHREDLGFTAAQRLLLSAAVARLG